MTFLIKKIVYFLFKYLILNTFFFSKVFLILFLADLNKICLFYNFYLEEKTSCKIIFKMYLDDLYLCLV